VRIRAEIVRWLKWYIYIPEVLNKLIPFMVRQARHERNQLLAVRPELVEGLNQSFFLHASNSFGVVDSKHHTKLYRVPDF
jgi:hypothetical protein